MDLFSNIDDDLGLEDLIQDSKITDKKVSEMTSEEIEDFKQSDAYKEYGANVRTVEDIKGNMAGKTVQEMLGLSDRKSRGYSYNSVECSFAEVEIYEDIIDGSPILQDTLLEGEAVLPTFKYLLQDLFLSLSKYKVNIRPESEMHTSVLLNRAVMEQLVNTPEYISLRRTCRLDQFNSALGTEILGKEAIEIIKQALENIKDLQKKKQAMDDLLKKEQEIDDIVEELEDLDDLINQAKQQGNASAYGSLTQQRDAMEQNLAQVKAIANKIAEECDDLIDDSDTVEAITSQMGSVFDQASAQVRETSEMCDMWGIGGDTSACNITFGNKKQAIEKIRRSPKLKKMTDIIGKFKESAITEQKKKAKHGAVEIKSVTVGDRIEDSLPSDRMYLCNETTKRDFHRRMSEKQLISYSKEAHKQKNKGPIIVCVDTSGSMSGDREIWSKALTVGVMEIAQLQKRDFACIIYSSYADKPIIIRKDEIAPTKVIDCAERFHNGGTDFCSPLVEAMELIKESTFKDADILFITDGDCGVSDDFVKKFKRCKEEKEFKTLGVLVDMGRGHHYAGTLEEFCDDITFVSNIADLTDSDSDVNKSIFGAL